MTNLALISPVMVFSLGGLGWLWAGKAAANPITPDTGSATQITQSGNEFTITGGVLSADGQALFHSFAEFGLSQAQIANFLAQPDVHSILGSVVGGEASYIDGLLQVTGSPADLYLINPAGILFGPNAQLDLAGSFAATTASGIQFDDATFNLLGRHDYSQFTGTPTGFVFAENAGVVVNGADLTVVAGEAITLMGGQVINTGTLTAPSGEITIAAIPDANLVRISQADMALSLEFATLPDADEVTLPFTPLTLPELLTGGGAALATEVAVTPEGTIALVNSALEIADLPGSAIAAGTLDASGAVGGDITVVGDRVSLVQANVDASGSVGGGTVRVGGDREGQPTLPGSRLTYVDGGSAIAADATVQNDGGTVILWSDSRTGFFGTVSAQGGIQSGDGGFVEVSGAQSLAFRGAVNTAAPVGQPGALLLDPVDIQIFDGTADGNDSDGFATLLSDTDSPLASPLPTILYESELEGLAGDTAVTLRASNNIAIADLADDELLFQTGTGAIRFEAGNGFSMAATDTLVAPGRDVAIVTGGSIVTGSIFTFEVPDNDDGSITLIGSEIQAGVLNALQPTPITTLGNGGNISRVSLESTQGGIVVDSLLSGSGGIVVNSAGRFRAEGTVDVAARPEKADASIVNDFTLSILAAVPLNPAEALATEGLDQAQTEAFLQPRSLVVRRGIRVDETTVRGVAIAFDLANQLPPLPLDFVIGPNSGEGITLAPGENGTVGGVFRTRPDRTLVTSFENQTFLIDSTLLPETTGLDNLSEGQNENATRESEPDANATASLLEICDENAGEPEKRCEDDSE
ncbi:MAG: filamentous hemagglutinin N-terminal domain-containing protein [Cyanobacteria bacterium P01_D01_bin.115]